jgi:hypothetical protein
VSDLEYFKCAFRTKLIKVNIKSPTLIEVRRMGSCHMIYEKSHESPVAG